MFQALIAEGIMTTYTKDIQFNLVVSNIKANTHNQALATLAKNAADYLNISEKTLLQRINDKEDLSISTIGDGVAIPHLKMRRIDKPFTMLMTLDGGVHCDTPDGQPVKIYGLLISPSDDGPIHLRRLSRVSRLLQNKTLHKRIEETQDRDVIQSLLMNPEGWLMAA